MSKDISHVDFFENPISINDPVIFSNGSRGLIAGRVHHLTPKMISVSYHTQRGETKKLLYPNELLIIEEEDMFMHLLKKK